MHLVGDAESLGDGVASCLGIAQSCMNRLLSLDQQHYMGFCPDAALPAFARSNEDMAVWATLNEQPSDHALVESSHSTGSSHAVVSAAAHLAYTASCCVGTDRALPDCFILWVAELMGSKPVALEFLSALVRSPACAYVWPSFGVKVLGDTPSLLLCQCLERLLKQAEPCIWGVFHGAGHSPCHVASRCLL